MASRPNRVRLRSAIPSGCTIPWADMMSRLQSEVPCFALADERDPSIFHPHDLRAAQISDPSCCRLQAHYGTHPSIDIDQNGLIGLVLPSGEFQLSVPPLPSVPLPLSLVTEILYPGSDDVCSKMTFAETQPFA
jgi:hypothetical protein